MPFPKQPLQPKALNCGCITLPAAVLPVDFSAAMLFRLPRPRSEHFGKPGGSFPSPGSTRREAPHRRFPPSRPAILHGKQRVHQTEAAVNVRHGQSRRRATRQHRKGFPSAPSRGLKPDSPCTVRISAVFSGKPAVCSGCFCVIPGKLRKNRIPQTAVMAVCFFLSGTISIARLSDSVKTENAIPAEATPAFRKL